MKWIYDRAVQHSLPQQKVVIMDLITVFQQLVSEVPEWAQPFIVALAGAVPFIEGEGGATVGIFGGINPVVAAISAAIGNFVCVAVLVWIAARARTAVVSRVSARSAQRTQAPAHSGAGVAVTQPAAGGANDVLLAEPASGAHEPVVGVDPVEDVAAQPKSARKLARQEKFQRALSRYGVPGVSLLGPLLLPTQFTATMLAAGGVAPSRVLLWQGAAIALWTTLFAVLMTQLLRTIAVL